MDIAPAPSAAPKPERIAALDVFRGITIAGMILVNNPGDWGHVYAPLRHAAWHGWTPTDLVFPFFLFIAGVSMAISFRRREEAGGRRWLEAAVARAAGHPLEQARRRSLEAGPGPADEEA